MHWSRTKILAQGQNSHVSRAKIIHGLRNFIGLLAQTKHDTTLSRDFSFDHFLGLFENGKRTIIFSPTPNQWSQALDRLKVVIKNMRASLHYQIESPILIVKVRHEHLNNNTGVGLTNCLDSPLKVLGTSILKIISGDRSYDNVIQIHALSRLGNPLGLVCFKIIRLSSFDCAKPTCTRTLFSCYHEGGSPLPPTFPAIRTLGFFANRHQAQILDHGLGIPKNRIIRQPNLNPVRLFIEMKGRIHLHSRTEISTATATTHYC